MAKAAKKFDSENPLKQCVAALRARDWTRVFTAGVLKRGRVLQQLGLVDIDKVVRRKRTQAIHIQAEVSSQSVRFSSYRTQIEICDEYGKPFLKFNCSCTAGDACKHAVAVVLEILTPAYHSPKPPPTAKLAAANDSAQHRALMQQLQRKAAELGLSVAEALDHDLHLRPAAVAASVPRLDPVDASNLRDWDDWLNRVELPPASPVQAYCELHYQLSAKDRRLTIQTLTRPRGGLGATLPYMLLPDPFAGGGDPWAAIAAEDRAVLMQVLTNQRSQLYSEERVLLGTHGEHTLVQVLARGAQLGTGPIARLAQPRRAEPRWQVQHDGSQQLRVQIDPPAEFAAIESLWYVDNLSGEIGPVEGLSPVDLERIRRAPSLRSSVRPMLAARFGALPAFPEPVEVKHRALAALSGARLKLFKPTTVFVGSEGRLAVLSFRYGEIWVDSDERGAPVSHTEGSVHTSGKRDLAGERSWQQRLRGIGLTLARERFFVPQPWWMPAHQPFTPAGWLGLLEPVRAAGIELELDTGFPLQLAAEPDEWYAELDPKDGSPWFELELGIRIGEERVSLLPILVKALASRSLSLTPSPQEPADATWLAPIDDKRRVRLPLAKARALIAPILEWLDQLGKGSALKLPALRADLIEAYAELAVSVKAGETLRLLASALKSEHGTARLPTPSNLKATLRDYQLDGITWLDFLGRHQLGGVLADDMGLGKTVQVLAHLLSERAQGRLSAPALVVMPTSLVPNWQAEAARFAPDLKVLTRHGSTRNSGFVRITDFDLVLTTYALLTRDFEELSRTRFDLVVFDEAQALKNPTAKAAQCARRLNAKRRLVMTGTPLENHLGELWAQVDLVLPGLLGGRREFTTHFRSPIEKHQDAQARSRLTRRLRPFLLRRNKQQVALELPPKTEIIRRVELQGGQRELYETLRLAMHDKVRKAIKARGIGQSSIIVLDALLKLRQACCDPRLVKLPAAARVRASAKRDALMELLEPLLDEGRRVLLFSQFTEMLDLIELELKSRSLAFVRLDGSTVDRAAPVAAFQREQVPLMLISLKAGGVGLNLTAADSVIHYDPWWNPAVENQATDRAHRIGQDKPVFVYKLVCADTVEDKIIALQARKSDLASAILDGGSSTRLQFDEQTIEDLLGGA